MTLIVGVIQEATANLDMIFRTISRLSSHHSFELVRPEKHIVNVGAQYHLPWDLLCFTSHFINICCIISSTHVAAPIKGKRINGTETEKERSTANSKQWKNSRSRKKQDICLWEQVEEIAWWKNEIKCTIYNWKVSQPHSCLCATRNTQRSASFFRPFKQKVRDVKFEVQPSGDWSWLPRQMNRVSTDDEYVDWGNLVVLSAAHETFMERRGVRWGGGPSFYCACFIFLRLLCNK